MNTSRTMWKKTTVALAVAVVIGGAATFNPVVEPDLGTFSLVSSAYAHEDGGTSEGGSGGHRGAMGAQQGGRGGGGTGGQGYHGGRSMSDVLSDDGDEEDSDRPEWAGVPGRDGKPGRPAAGEDTQKGGDYGDLFVVLRNDDGSPVTVGSEHYILLADGTVVLTEGGEVPPGVSAELLQPVEFGRMNIARAPDSVMEHALTEALSKLDGLTVTAETIEALTDAAGRFTIDGLTIDSPLENLALYQALLTAETNDEGVLVLTATSSHDGADTTYTLLVDPTLRLDLAASALAASSDKTGELLIDEVVLISSFLGVEDELAALVGAYNYDREAAYDVVVNVLVEQPDGSFVPTDVNLYQTLSADDGDIYGFNTVERPYLLPDGSLAVDTNLTGIDIFTQAADDAVQAIEFVHEFER